MKKLLQNFGIIILTLVVLAGIMSMIHVGEEKPKDVGINTLVSYVQDDKVEKVEIEKDTILVTVKDISTVAEDERGKQLKIKKV